MAALTKSRPAKSVPTWNSSPDVRAFLGPVIARRDRGGPVQFDPGFQSGFQHALQLVIESAFTPPGPALSPPFHPDAGIIELGRQMAEADAAWRVAVEAGETQDDHPLYDHAKDCVDKICAMPAVTVEGILVKVRAIMWCCNFPEDLSTGPGACTDERVMFSMMADVCRMDGRGHPDLRSIGWKNAPPVPCKAGA